MKNNNQNNSEIINVLSRLGSPKRAKASTWFFKTGKGQYGEGDQFIGVTVPEQRKIAHQFKDMPLPYLKKLLKNPIHEHRFVALEILVIRYENGNQKEKDEIANFYLNNRKYINNWDLVDTSAPYILGDYLLQKSKKILYSLAKSKILWDRRIAIVATARFIKEGRYTDTLKISEILLKDKEDLIHKATGWMLREVGKKYLKTELEFLNKHHKKMPRTMLRYAIERLPEKLRKHYMAK